MSADPFFDELRREYLTEAPARMAELKKDLAAARAGEADAVSSLKHRLHRLAGSGGSYGFPDISKESRAAERWIGDHPSPDGPGLDAIERMLGGIAACFDRASREVGLPESMPVRPNFGWRAVLLSSGGEVADQLGIVLAQTGFEVHRLSPAAKPDGIPVSERPDLAVIIGADDHESADVAARWTQPGAARPLAVGLVGTIAPLDPFAPALAGLDFLIDTARAEVELARFAHTFAQARTAPRAVLVITGGSSDVDRVIAALESTGVTVSSARTSPEIRDALERTPPDLIVLSWALGGMSAPTIVRWVRQLEPHRITPILVLGELSDQERISAEQVGVDLVISAATAKSVLTHALLSRIERAFVVRTRSHRDDLTGLSSRSALIHELEHQVAHARRMSESISYLALDLDHFRRINERWGPAVGDLVLKEVARLVMSAVRAGDFVARMGGEEIGVLIRRCSAENAVKLAEKLRAAVSEHPLAINESSIPVRLSIGTATYPDHGPSAEAILRVADRALKAAKAAGRDRVQSATPS